MLEIIKMEVNGKLDSMESTINQMQTTVESLTTQVDNLSQNVTNLSGAVSTMQNTVNTLQQNFTSLTEAVAGINDELDKIQSGELVLPYLKNTGDTGTGTYNFTGATVNVAAPTQAANAATKKYVDDINTALSAAIDAEEQRATEAEDALGQRIDSEAEARADEDAELNAAIEEVKGQVENLTDGTTVLPYVKKAGDTMTGDLSMGNQSITHAYCIQLSGNNPKAFINSNNEAAIASIATPNNYNVLNVGAPVKDTHAATKKYVDDADDVLNAAIQKEVQDRETAIEGIQTEIDGVSGDLSGYLPLTGGTMTGALNVQTPTEDANAATKAYVDQAVQNATDPELEGRVEALETSQATQDTEIANLKSGTTALPYIKDTGDTVTGTYDFTGADLTVKAPTAEASPATKAYVDSAVENASNPELEGKVEALETSQTQQDTKIEGIINGTTDIAYVKKAGDTMSGALTTPTGIIHSTNEQGTDAHITHNSTHKLAVQNAGGTLVNLQAAEPVDAADVVTKNYVDTQIEEKVQSFFLNNVLTGPYFLSRVSLGSAGEIANGTMWNYFNAHKNEYEVKYTYQFAADPNSSSAAAILGFKNPQTFHSGENKITQDVFAVMIDDGTSTPYWSFKNNGNITLSNM